MVDVGLRERIDVSFHRIQVSIDLFGFDSARQTDLPRRIEA